MENHNHPKRGYCRDLPYEPSQYVPHLSPLNADKYQDTIYLVSNISSPSVKYPVRYPIPFNEYPDMICESINSPLQCRMPDYSLLSEGHDYRIMSTPPSGGTNLTMHLTGGDHSHLMKRSPSEIQSPINMENQEVKKMSMKRERNRVAAAKCRKKKLEKIAQLEEKARLLREENNNLLEAFKKLKQEVDQLEQKYSPYVPYDPFRAGKLTPCTPTSQMRVEKWAQEREEIFRKSTGRLKEDIVTANSLVQEANYLAEEMGKQVKYSVTLQIPPANLSPNRKRRTFVSEPAILVKRKGNGSQVWSMEKLETKLVDMREMFDK